MSSFSSSSIEVFLIFPSSMHTHAHINRSNGIYSIFFLLLFYFSFVVFMLWLFWVLFFHYVHVLLVVWLCRCSVIHSFSTKMYSVFFFFDFTSLFACSISCYLHQIFSPYLLRSASLFRFISFGLLLVCIKNCVFLFRLHFCFIFFVFCSPSCAMLHFEY